MLILFQTSDNQVFFYNNFTRIFFFDCKAILYDINDLLFDSLLSRVFLMNKEFLYNFNYLIFFIFINCTYAQSLIGFKGEKMPKKG